MTEITLGPSHVKDDSQPTKAGTCYYVRLTVDIGAAHVERDGGEPDYKAIDKMHVCISLPDNNRCLAGTLSAVVGELTAYFAEILDRHHDTMHDVPPEMVYLELVAEEARRAAHPRKTHDT